MAALLADLVASAKAAAGKEDDPSVSDVQWRVLIDKGIKALFRKLATQFADNWIQTFDFTLTASVNSVTLPSNFEQLRHITKDPTLSSRIRIDPFNLQSIERYGFPRYRAMGRTIYMEPPENAAGNFRAWYVPRPMLFAGDFTVRLKTVAQFNPVTLSGGPGPGFTITRSGNEALVVDGKSAVAGDRVLVDSASAMPAANLGIYSVVNPGSAGTPWILTRATDYDTAGNGEVRLWNTVMVTDGTAAIGQTWQLQVFNGAVDVAAQSYGLAVLDPTLEPYNEFIEQWAASLALEGEKSDSSQQRARIAEMEDELEAMAGAQEAGGQTAIADVEEFSIAQRSRFWRPDP